MYDYGFRFYSPGLGRWINRDPIQELGGLNMYMYVANNPTNLSDPYGLDWVDLGRGIAKGVGAVAVGVVVVGAMGIASPAVATAFAVVGAAAGGWAIGTEIYEQWTGEEAYTGRELTVCELDEGAGEALVGAATFAIAWRTSTFGHEPTFANGKLRLAPFGNRIPSDPGHINRLPHYHRARPAQSKRARKRGESAPGQSIDRHRPQEVRKEDKSFWDRF
jgi:hypothetical protein